VVVPSANVALERIIQVSVQAIDCCRSATERTRPSSAATATPAPPLRLVVAPHWIALPTLALADTASTLESIGDLWSLAAGGSIGVLSSIFFTASAKALRSGQTLVDALIDGQERVSQSGGARLGDRTLLDALVPALHALRQGVTSMQSQQQRMVLSRHSEDAARACWPLRVHRRLLGIVDPGALAIAIKAFESIV
jgi:hypothetical protein